MSHTVAFYKIALWGIVMYSAFGKYSDPSSIYTQYLIIAEQKNRNTLFTYVFRTFAVRLETELRCIFFPLIILEMFLQLHWSPPVVNSIDWT
jgi:hypothetical protein